MLAEEEERQRLSRELHDSAGQVLTALQLNLSLLGQSLAAAVSISYYRFLQEGLTNLVKHAQADSVQVKLSYDDDTLYLLIEDNGIGFTPATELERPEGVGLLGLQERFELLGGQLEIDSRPGQGTRLMARYQRESYLISCVAQSSLSLR